MRFKFGFGCLGIGITFLYIYICSDCGHNIVEYLGAIGDTNAVAEGGGGGVCMDRRTWSQNSC